MQREEQGTAAGARKRADVAPTLFLRNAASLDALSTLIVALCCSSTLYARESLGVSS